MSSDEDARARVITRAVVDALLLRRELKKHDLSVNERFELLVAAMPALITWEASEEAVRRWPGL